MFIQQQQPGPYASAYRFPGYEPWQNPALGMSPENEQKFNEALARDREMRRRFMMSGLNMPMTSAPNMQGYASLPGLMKMAGPAQVNWRPMQTAVRPTVGSLLGF